MPDDIYQYAKPGPYTTELTPDEETQFQAWVKENNVPWQDTADADYDMRGYWKAMKSGDPEAAQSKSEFDQKMHFPDTYKTPFHKTFSNESKYAMPDAPHWENDRLVDKDGKVIADETPSSDRSNPITDAAGAPSSFPGTQQFWNDTFLYGRMPAAQPTKQQQRFEKPDIQLPGESIDKSMVHAPPYGDTQSPSGEEMWMGSEDRPWMDSENKLRLSNISDQSDEDLPPRFRSGADAYGSDDDPGWSVGEGKGATEQFWKDTFLYGPMPEGDQPDKLGQPNIYNIGPGTQDYNPIIHGSEDTGPQQFKFKRQHAPLGLDYTDISWDDFPLA